MRQGACSRRVRTARFLLLLALVALPGCLREEGPPLAQPTDATPVVPASPPRRPTVEYNFRDAGYVVTTPWHVGDGWDYASNASTYRQVRVVDQRLVGETTQFLVEERTGREGSTSVSTTRAWVDSGRWVTLNVSDARGEQRYQPGQPLRYYRNGSYAYNVTVFDASGAKVTNATVAVQSRVSAGHTTLLLRWGYVEARRVEQSFVSRDAQNKTTEAFVTRWVHRDYANDVQYQLPNGEMFKLVAAKVGDFRRGSLAT